METKDIICISMTTWEGNYMKTIVHMMKQLSRHHRVLFVDYPFTWKDVAFSAIGKSNAPVKRMLGIKSRLRKLDDSLYHLTLPPVFPTNWIENFDLYKAAMKGQSRTIEHALKKAIQQLNMENPLVINAFNPLVGLSLLGKLNESGTIYYCYDEIRAAQWCGKHGGRMEDEFISQVDSVVTTSANLTEVKSRKNPNTYQVSNGVDFDLFNRAADPYRFEKPTKTIGYVGSIDFRLDYDLLEKVLERFPSYRFKFVGRVTDEYGFQRLKKYPNTEFTGGLQPNDIPRAMSEFDLGLIPFSINEFTKNIYPLKINEYLAAGIPVVSTDFADLSEFENIISIDGSIEGFANAIELELCHDNWEKSLGRFSIARGNDWSARAAKMERVIDHFNQEIYA